MSIDILPNEILTIILKKLALQERILLRVVSTRWKVVIEDMCHLRRSLMLMQDIGFHFTQEGSLNHFDYDYLVLKRAGHDQDDDLLVRKPSAFKEVSCQLLASLFPCLDRLVLQLSKNHDRITFKTLRYLLENGWPNLKSLSFIGDYGYTSTKLPHFKEKVAAICNAINSKKSLEHLDLLEDDMFEWHYSGETAYYPKPSYDLSVTLPRLKHFSFTDELTNDLPYILSKLVRCTSLEFDFCELLNVKVMKKIVEKNTQLTKLTHLRLRDIVERPDPSSMSKVAYICEQFKQLNSLYLEFEDSNGEYSIPFNLNLIGHIVKLPQLTDLILKHIVLTSDDLNLFRVKIENGTCPRIGSVRRFTIRELCSVKIMESDFESVDDDSDDESDYENVFESEDDESEDNESDVNERNDDQRNEGERSADNIEQNDNEVEIDNENVENANDIHDEEDIALDIPVDPVDEALNVALFCKTLAFIFPNLQQLTISNYFYSLDDQFDDRFVAQLTDNLHYFDHLQKHKICAKYVHEPKLYGRHEDAIPKIDLPKNVFVVD